MSKIENQNQTIANELNDGQVEQLSGGGKTYILPENPYQVDRLREQMHWKWQMENGQLPSIFRTKA